MSLKKPIFWDLKKPTLLSNLLYPFSYLVRFNNFINERKLKKKNDKRKTPTKIKVYNLTKKINKKIAIGKKYYPAHNDENTILKNISNLILEKSRFDIIQKAAKRKIKIIIFDDGLQDKEIDYDLKFVCFHSNNGIGNGRIIPSGPLRELKESIKKYDGVFLQNSFKPNMAKSVIKSIKKINPEINIFKTKYQPINLHKLNRNKKYLIFSGIGNPENFKNLLLKNKIKIIKEMDISLNAKIITT